MGEERRVSLTSHNQHCDRHWQIWPVFGSAAMRSQYCINCIQIYVRVKRVVGPLLNDKAPTGINWHCSERCPVQCKRILLIYKR